MFIFKHSLINIIIVVIAICGIPVILCNNDVVALQTIAEDYMNALEDILKQETQNPVEYFCRDKVIHTDNIHLEKWLGATILLNFLQYSSTRTLSKSILNSNTYQRLNKSLKNPAQFLKA
ncbi:uncharacterized protein LOC113548155 [Rhopalosiphum maidis]|uniref:uncharacterized protein LOC113548155 n=1 Tax=Rhopalosiphum maidis TaxID=43146 RepID=UPI000F006034|nr:uncharacterized protein LOC113548155 [Rhopalosiphum maidis]